MLPPPSFLFAAILLAFTPGPGIAYVIARTFNGGKREGIASTVGTMIGGMLHVLAAACGFSLLLIQSPSAFAVIRFTGITYLLFLGIRSWFTASEAPENADIPVAKGIFKAFKEGVIVEALNIKTALFFLSFIPQFISKDADTMLQFTILGSICVFLNSSADLIAVMATERLTQSHRSQITQSQNLSKISGIIMILLAIWLASFELPLSIL